MRNLRRICPDDIAAEARHLKGGRFTARPHVHPKSGLPDFGTNKNRACPIAPPGWPKSKTSDLGVKRREFF
jgi:hypothetical protein